MMNYALPVKRFVSANDPCVCGSGKKAKKCCFNLYSHGPDCLTKDGRHITYDKVLEDDVFSKLRELFMNTLFVNSSQIDFDAFFSGVFTVRPVMVHYLPIESTIERYMGALDIIEPVIANLHKFASCSEGCSHCCRLLVETTPLEAEVIRRYVVDTFSPSRIAELTSLARERAKLIPAFDYANNSLIDRYSNDYDEAYNSCIFLNTTNGCCSIYDVRPFQCRSYFAFKEVDICAKKGANNLFIRSTTFGATIEFLKAVSGIVYGTDVFYSTDLPKYFTNGFDSLSIPRR